MARKITATKDLLEAILKEIARGLSERQACALHGITDRTFRNWKQRKEFEGLKDKAEALALTFMLDRIESCSGMGTGDWNRWKFLLQKRFPKQFGDDPMLLMAQQNNYYLPEEKTREIDARVQRLLEDKS